MESNAYQSDSRSSGLICPLLAQISPAATPSTTASSRFLELIEAREGKSMEGENRSIWKCQGLRSVRQALACLSFMTLEVLLKNRRCTLKRALLKKHCTCLLKVCKRGDWLLHSFLLVHSEFPRLVRSHFYIATHSQVIQKSCRVILSWLSI